ncbi:MULTISPECIES: cytochrome c oxidase assembly protein [Alteromonas]|jgi:cytochrome c oxidase assembly protein subunit 11|uniref:Cytochrome c oxidase assembly protein CtaG n=1 Tax=Alteromonas stellipolaris TaxID=233316 RepID=A0ABM5YNL4_9ALTE|nr:MULTISPECIES: cytochrome c oxidase assembly protein [Alteromonas]AMJ92434.1 cytochrome C oxidase assembly protein [Alteromonas sp. Mac2]ALM92596.1 Cytochrome oxidase biogenesis protein Cox11-CtaG, copper delivery to Cox1 [Alteromonas stellipolaris LMG 21856]AMJ76149.1 cytochrome C oxidase assembly protein [Alteromonas stellipolaris]AMJ88579.1 cytochrome C oxidase assembly protein [Alteromonas sp. Mac1]AMJ96269.1 cytochrome C oxidase assembly protein [Alteromonas stellipolaris]
MTQINANNKMVIRLVVIVFGMFGFGFALVPLYDVFCDVTGINGKTENTAAVYEFIEIDESREVTVEFITRTNTGMPWEFRAQTTRMKVHPGELNTVSFYVRNPASNNMMAQAIPSVSPGMAALYLNKTECFCFNQQPLSAGAEAYMPMQFYVDPQLPEEISYFTVQYTLFDVTARASDMKTKPNPYMVPQPESGK